MTPHTLVDVREPPLSAVQDSLPTNTEAPPAKTVEPLAPPCFDSAAASTSGESDFDKLLCRLEGVTQN
jgi:hypothetical protein